MPVTQAGRWRGVSWGLRLQIAFRPSYHLQLCRLSKLDAGGVLVGGHDSKWHSSLLTIYSHADYPSWTLEGCQLGVTTSKWPSSLPTSYSRAGYPSWMLEGHQLGGHGLLVFLSFAPVLVTQARH